MIKDRMNPKTRPVALITGATRGIGKAIALKLAANGYDIVVAGKTLNPHPSLPGTLSQTCQEIEALGAQALAVQVDVRFEEQIVAMMASIKNHFGRLDCLVNNASAIDLGSTEKMTLKKYDLMHQINVRGSFLCAQHSFELLKQSPRAHVLHLSPPIDLDPKWFKNHLAYTLSKYGMSMIVLGLSAEWSDANIAVNALWPKTIIATAAIAVNMPESFLKQARNPEIVAEAAMEILKCDPKKWSGKFFIDEDFLRTLGHTNFETYAIDPTQPLIPDLYL
jgi:citronellol/citronellal dehydrogenase